MPAQALDRHDIDIEAAEGAERRIVVIVDRRQGDRVGPGILRLRRCRAPESSIGVLHGDSGVLAKRDIDHVPVGRVDDLLGGIDAQVDPEFQPFRRLVVKVDPHGSAFESRTQGDPVLVQIVGREIKA